MSGTHRSLLGGRLASTQSQAHGPGGFKEKEDSTTDGERKQSQQEGEVDEETDIWFHLESWVSGNQVTVVFLLIIVTTLIQPSFNGSAPESKKFLSQTTANVVHNLLFEQRVEPSSIRCGADGPMGSNLLFVRAGNETICGSDSHDLRIYPAEIIEARAGTAGGADDVLVRFDMRSYERQELIRVVILSITVVLVRNHSNSISLLTLSFFWPPGSLLGCLRIPWHDQNIRKHIIVCECTRTYGGIIYRNTYVHPRPQRPDAETQISETGSWGWRDGDRQGTEARRGQPSAAHAQDYFFIRHRSP